MTVTKSGFLSFLLCQTVILTTLATGFAFESPLDLSDPSKLPPAPANAIAYPDRVGSQLEAGSAETGLFGDKTSSSRPCGSAPETAPQNATFWTELRRLKVDFINTDHLTTFRNFDQKYKAEE